MWCAGGQAHGCICTQQPGSPTLLLHYPSSSLPLYSSSSCCPNSQGSSLGESSLFNQEKGACLQILYCSLQGNRHSHCTVRTRVQWWEWRSEEWCKAGFLPLRAVAFLCCLCSFCSIINLSETPKSCHFGRLTSYRSDLSIIQVSRSFYSTTWCEGCECAQLVERLPSAQVRIWILGSWDQVLHQAPYPVGSLLLLLPLPAAPLACALSLKK